MKYKVALRASEEGFAVSVPGLPGCWSQGTTEAEALENIKQAIEQYLTVVDDGHRERGRVGTSHFPAFPPDSPAEASPSLQDNRPICGATCHARRWEP